VTDQPEDDVFEPLSTRTKVIAGIVVVLVLLAGGYLMLRFSSPTIQPSQAPPAGHYTFPCRWCHSISVNAKPIGVS
jgi:hypothetical protein